MENATEHEVVTQTTKLKQKHNRKIDLGLNRSVDIAVVMPSVIAIKPPPLTRFQLLAGETPQPRLK